MDRARLKGQAMSGMSHSLGRIEELVERKRRGCEVTCEPVFEIVPVDFTQRNFDYRAYVFLCRYTGRIDGESYAFRKCYARGCPNNLCPHVSQAVMIANRHLHRDCERLSAAGIQIPQREFALDDMMVNFDGAKEEAGPLLNIYDYIRMAAEGQPVRVDITLEYLLAVEHFAEYKNAQTFLYGEFAVQAPAQKGSYQRCLACYATEREKEEKPQAVRIANQRLSLLYREFDKASIQYGKLFFE
jgi:hypothetical protein